MNFLPKANIEKINEERFWEMFRAIDPDLFNLKLALLETGINPVVLSRLIHSLLNLAIGTGYGKITVYMEDGRITRLEGTEFTKVEEKIILDKR